MSKAQRTKGAAGEREICDMIFENLGIEVHRNLQQTRDGGADIKLKPYSIEVKRRAAIGNIYDWIARPRQDVMLQNVRLLYAEQTENNGLQSCRLRSCSGSSARRLND